MLTLSLGPPLLLLLSSVDVVGCSGLESKSLEPIDPSELAAGALELKEDAEALARAKKLTEKIKSEQGDLQGRINSDKNDRIKDLLARRNELLVQISSVAKTLRFEHDNKHPRWLNCMRVYSPDLRDSPIVIVAKDDSDVARVATQMAELQGVDDVLNGISSPCAILSSVRDKSVAVKRGIDFMGEQAILDSMSFEKRLHYDARMIEHYERLIVEIERGIDEATHEINSDWQARL